MTALGDSVLLEGKLQLVLRESLLNLWNQISGDCGLWLKITELQIKNELEVCSLSESEPWGRLALEFAFRLVPVPALWCLLSPGCPLSHMLLFLQVYMLTWSHA